MSKWYYSCARPQALLMNMAIDYFYVIGSGRRIWSPTTGSVTSSMLDPVLIITLFILLKANMSISGSSRGIGNHSTGNHSTEILRRKNTWSKDTKSKVSISLTLKTLFSGFKKFWWTIWKVWSILCTKMNLQSFPI